ncbi:MAG: ATP-dependent DNA helicase [Rhodoferax sp.]
MGLPEAVQRAFEPDGPLARLVEAFKPRPGQMVMAQAVARTMESGGVLAVEAGTGVGKTFAYLIPALLSGERVLLSTATKALQDQLFGRDIPRLMAALGQPVRVALLKGRGSYLCIHRLASARQDVRADDSVAQLDLARVEMWAAVTRSGDLAELAQLDERSPVVPLVTSTRENCLGAQCPQAQTCHVNRARKEAMAADVVVINHHLFFADLNVRESGVAELLPTVRTVVFDEAHQLNEIGVQFLGRQLTTGRLEKLCRTLAVQGPQLALGTADWRTRVAELTQAVGLLRHLCGGTSPLGRRPWLAEAPLGIPVQPWRAALAAVRGGLQQVDAMLERVEELSPELKGLRERTVALLAELELFSSPVPPSHVRWLEANHHVRLVQSPLDIAVTLQSRIALQDGRTDSNKSWIFTSATLGTEPSMGWFLQTCGLEGAQVLQVDSPFDYAAQAGLYIPPHMPKPGDPSHSACVALLAAHGAEILGGRTLVLTTTLRAMRSIGDALRQYFAPFSAIQVLVQGQSPKRELVERFCGEDSKAAGCVLVASASFWEGIDVPGDALQMVIIDKLPFSPPDDPLVEARARQMEGMGKNPFQHFHVPQAAIALKQGAGRLIRRETDRGVLVVCDVRLNQMGYGRKMLAALPAMRTIATHEEFERALHALTRPSTTDPYPCYP